MTTDVRPTWGQKVIPIKPVVHSWSSLNEFEQCPWKWYLTKIAKVVEFRQSEQMREGNERHTALERAVRDGLPLPDKYVGDQPVVEKLRASPGEKIVEWQFGITRNWTECRFFADDVWIRGKIDVGVIGEKHALLIDYKTGKMKGAEYDQLGLFAIPAFIRWPYLETVRTAYLWLGDKKLDPKVYTSADTQQLREMFAFRIQRIEHAIKSAPNGAERAFPKIPSGLCRGWCPAGSKNCEYWAPKKES